MIFLNDAVINSPGSLKGTFPPTAHIFFSVVLFIYLLLVAPGLHCCVGFSLVTVHGCLIVLASLVEHGL